MEAAKGRGTGTTPARLLDPEQFEQAERRIWPLPPKIKMRVYKDKILVDGKPI